MGSGIQVGIGKGNNFKWIFVEFFIVLGFSYVLLTLFLICISLFLYGLNIIRPANFVEKQVLALEQSIANSGIDDDVIKNIPQGASYALLDKNKQVLETDMTEQVIDNGLSYISIGSAPKYYYRYIEEEKVNLLIEYPLQVTFSSPLLNKIPVHQRVIFMFLILISLYIAITALIILKFVKRLRMEFSKLTEVTEHIKKQNLDFPIPESAIDEFNQVLVSLGDLKGELRDSLERQWRLEEGKKKQMASLTHDIKTPLTIIKGNADLLDEELTGEDKELVAYISRNALRIEEYLDLLMEMSKGNDIVGFHKKKISSDQFFESIMGDMCLLGKKQEVSVEVDIGHECKELNIDPELIHRGISNIITNAISFSQAGQSILIKVSFDDKECGVRVRDHGIGFSQEELACAKEEFFMGDHSRHGGKHYGLGLYITEQIAKLHDGRLCITNWQEGAEVSIMFNYI